MFGIGRLTVLVGFEAGFVDGEGCLDADGRERAECKTVLCLVQGPDGMVEAQLCPVLGADIGRVLGLHLTRAHSFYHYDKVKIKNNSIIHQFDDSGFWGFGVLGFR